MTKRRVRTGVYTGGATLRQGRKHSSFKRCELLPYNAGAGVQ